MKKFLSAFLSVVMLLSLSVNVFAAGYDSAYVQVDVDGGLFYSTSGRASGSIEIVPAGARELESLEINDSWIPVSMIADSESSSNRWAANGSDYTSGEYRVFHYRGGVYMSWNGLRTSLYVTAKTMESDTYEVSARCQPGSSCDISNADATVTAGGDYTVRFSPVSGGREIQAITFNVGGRTQDVSVPYSGTTSVTVNGQSADITNVNGIVTVSIASVTADTVITAQVYNYGNRHIVTVRPDAGIKASFATDYVSDGAREVITLTPGSRVNVGRIGVSSGNHDYVIDLREESCRVNGMYFEIDRLVDGTVEITIDGVYADIDVRPYVDTDTARIEVVADRDLVNCDKRGVQYVSMYEPFAVRFEARRDTLMSKIRITTDTGTYTADTDEDTIRVNGQYFNIYRNIDGDVTLNITRVPGNMKIELVARDTVHDVKVSTDSRVDADVTRTEVDDGDSLEIKFTPKDRTNEIRQIRVTLDGSTYKADPSKDKYVTVDGARWYFRFGTDNSVILECEDITGDLSVYASTVKNGNAGSGSSDKTYKITKTPDRNSNISYSGSNPFDSGDDSDIRVYTDSGYILKSVRINVNGRSATVSPFDKTVKVDGETYDITWKSNADMTIKLYGIYADVTVSSTSVKGTEKYPDGSSNNNNSNPNAPDDSWTVTVKPTTPSTIPDGNQSNKNPGVGAYHPAYMYGFSDNTFRPDQSMTRAQAVAILCRLYSGVADSDFKAYAANPGFQDVNPNSTFAGYIGYAKQQGHLAGMVGSGLNFSPNAAITRAEFCYLLCRFTAANLVGVSTTQMFSDVPSTHWAIVYINYCADRSWANGYADGIFKPDSSLTRAQICAIINRINNRVVGTATVGFNLRNFNDVSRDHWAYSEIMEASHNHTVARVENGSEVWA